MRHALLTGVVVLAGCFLTGCSASPGLPVDYSGDVIEASRSSDLAPEAFRTRTALPTCGDVELDQGDTIPAVALDCLETARAVGGELAVSSPTTEGDPTVTFYRVGPKIEGIEIFADATRDRFGAGEWWVESCPAGSSIDGHGSCVDIAAE